MTAEVTILNKHAVALAADSAITLTTGMGKKTVSGNKLFSLSKHHPVGVMFYGSTEFMDIPWESLIKLFRSEHGATSYSVLSEYGDQFIKFLSTKNPHFTDEAELRHVHDTASSYFAMMIREIRDAVQDASGQSQIDRDLMENIVVNIISSHHTHWKKAKRVKGFGPAFEKKLKDEFDQVIGDCVPAAIFDLTLTSDLRGQLSEIGRWLFYKEALSANHCGIVIAGFGEKDIFPSVVAYKIEGRVNGKLKYLVDEDGCFSVTGRDSSRVIPFAQTEMVHTFMNGIDPVYREKSANTLAAMLRGIYSTFYDTLLTVMPDLSDEDKEALKKGFDQESVTNFRTYLQEIQTLLGQRYELPVSAAVAHLPKDELAHMAEVLVSLTSLRRKVDSVAETVGGPVDVAVISKGDGFIWVKRKHYFDLDCNPHFVGNYHYRNSKTEVGNAK